MKINTAVCPKCSNPFTSEKILLPGIICPSCKREREEQKETMPRSLTTVRGVFGEMEREESRQKKRRNEVIAETLRAHDRSVRKIIKRLARIGSRCGPSVSKT